MEEHAARDLPLAALAGRAAMSTRTLSRRFVAEVGTTPARWLARARVRRAQRLLETTSLSVERVAADVGFGSATVLREQFARVLGTSPRGYRVGWRTAGSRHD
jgi:transcriptional regulator GlxA family with amidase domain